MKKIIDFALNYGIVIVMAIAIAYGLWYNLK